MAEERVVWGHGIRCATGAVASQVQSTSMEVDGWHAVQGKVTDTSTARNREASLSDGSSMAQLPRR